MEQQIINTIYKWFYNKTNEERVNLTKKYKIGKFISSQEIYNIYKKEI